MTDEDKQIADRSRNVEPDPWIQSIFDDHRQLKGPEQLIRPWVWTGWESRMNDNIEAPQWDQHDHVDMFT